MNNNPTPCGALFDVMKKHASISYKELAGLILSNRPLSDGRSPISRVGDRTWISRFIVHAPAGSLQERYFCDYGVAALLAPIVPCGAAMCLLCFVTREFLK